MAYRDQGSGAGADLPAKVELEIRRLSPRTRERIAKAIATERVHAEGPDGGAAIGAGLLGALGVGGAIALAAFEIGVVDGSQAAHALLGSLGWALAGAMIARGGVGLAASRRVASELPAGRHLVPGGIVEVTGTRVAITPSDRIAAIHEVVEPPGPSGLSLIRLHVRTDDRATEPDFLIFGTAANLRAIALHRVRERAQDIRSARASGDRDGLAAAELVSREELADAQRASGMPGPIENAAKRPWLVSASVGLVIGALAYLVALPAASAARAAARPDAWGWHGVLATHPLPWTQARARAEIALRQRAAIEALSGPSPELEALRAALEHLVARGERTLLVRVGSPPQARIEEANRALAAIAPPGSEPAEILLFRPSYSSYGLDEIPGSAHAAGALRGALGIQDDLFVLEGERRRDEGPLEAPRVVLEADVRVTGALTGDGRLAYAALEFTFAPRIEVPGRPPVSLGAPIVVAPPDEMDVMRSPFAGTGAAPLDPTGIAAVDRLLDASVYVAQLERAAGTAAEALAARMRP